ncbi:probable protein phosphatase 2C 75 isoform X4 [Cucurbita pepo subsp. pepo]|uniref:probable protein phosphatase 2C 75 isoform X4 n=1 Tax=Cucurbita pepo subsp. pepo TaxID=3664 RepID=UPI000C9D6DAC|nr:probable protein phosphatase 2C 75 isoform X4 [Cucurbita pepo subsp. pepo]
MTEVYCRMPSDDDIDSPAKCRERRRRRIEMRRLAAVPSAKPSPSPSTSQHHRKENQTESSGLEKKRVRKTDGGDTPEVLTSSSSGEDVNAVVASSSVPQPVFGMMSVSGRSREMEDAVSVSTCLIGPERRLPVHFFAVYDGHGGPHVATLCMEKMHVLVQEELARVVNTREETESIGGGSSVAEEEATWRRVMRRSFERMDEVALNTCACGSVGGQCACHPMEVALGGSTAVVAVLTPEHIIVANCGDSRAVLCRGGRAIPLSNDHKPDRIDELARIEAAGGQVIFINGARVKGILAMSRAIGDKYLKSVVISEPEITFTKREPDDECLILASDGLWDVLSSELACEVARECLQETVAASSTTIDLNALPQIEEGAGTSYTSRSSVAAALLTRLALGRKSTDNISVIVIDLKRS